MVMVFGLVIVALSTSYVAQSGSVAAVIHCINGLNVTAGIGVMLIILSPFLLLSAILGDE